MQFSNIFVLFCTGKATDLSLLNRIAEGIALGVLHLVRGVSISTKVFFFLPSGSIYPVCILQHEENIIHRDLAARNVLLTNELRPKIRLGEMCGRSDRKECFEEEERT